MSIIVVGSEEQRRSLLRSARCSAAGHSVLGLENPSRLEAHAARTRLVFANASQAAPVLEALKAARSKARVMLVAEHVETHTLRLALASARIVGVSASPSGLLSDWESTYITRRIIAPADPTPVVSDLVPWGATNISWTPRTTSEMRRIVEQIEGMAKNLGCDRRESTAVSTAAHELLMNAMYDAPVGSDGKPLYALERQKDLTLPQEQAPTFRFTISADFVGLDVGDPFGRLPRKRFFEGVLRGHLNLQGAEAPQLDTSHGGAGLGLHTLYSSGSVLRAELRPLQYTHVSWMLARRGAQVDRSARSLYFTPLLEQK